MGYWWTTNWRRRAKRAQARRLHPTSKFRPVLEYLESRTVPSSFQGLGQMPGASAATGGTAALGISGDGNVIVGYGWVPSSLPGGFAQQAFRWTPTGGYQLLGDLGSGTSIADAASFDGSVVVGESPPAGAIFGSFRWTA